jgi:hypothetical protein
MMDTEKDLSRTKDYQQMDPFSKIYHKRYQVADIEKQVPIELMGEKPTDMGAGGKAIDFLLNSDINEPESLVKANDVTEDVGERVGRKVYIPRDEAPPPGVSLYRGKEGGRFFYENEKERTESSSQDKKKELASKIQNVTQKMQKEYNNLGNIKPRISGNPKPIGAGKPDLPQNQGVFKGENLAPTYARNPNSPKLDAGKMPNLKVPKLESIKNQANPFAIATAQAKKEGYSNFKEGSPGEKRVDEISESIKGTKKSLSDRINKYIAKHTSK